MEIGGVERSLINLLSSFDYDEIEIDLMIYRHKGDFLNMVPSNVNIIDEIPEYSTFRKTILEVINDKYYMIGLARLFSKIIAIIKSKVMKLTEPGYLQMQLMWKYSMRFLPEFEKEYDIAISYLWPHYFVSEKVRAKKKIAWIHTDYSVIEADIKKDLKIWKKFDNIIAVSEACKQSFLKKYPVLEDRVKVIENINSVKFIRSMAEEKVENPLLKDNRFKIVTVARLSYAKGIDIAVEAMKFLLDSGNKNIAWYVIGYGGDEEKIRKLIEKYKLQECFFLLGKKKNPYPFIKSADLYVQPSRYEGKAVTVIEAQILTKPVLITNYSTSESQINNKVDGYIADLSSANLAKEIKMLYQNPHIMEELKSNCSIKDYSNNTELKKLYTLIG